TRGAEHKARQTGGARFVYSVKSGGKAALAGDEVGPAFENLRRQTCGHGFRLRRERTSHVKPAGRVMTGDNFDRTDRLRSPLLRSIKCILGASSARCDLRYIKVAREPLLFLDVGEL